MSYTAEWSDPSESVSKAVPLCPAPVFGESSYGFTVATTSSVGAVVGTVSAAHPDQTKLTYSITAGNEDGHFAIGAGGVITVAGALDHEETPSYALTVVATEPRGKSGTTTVSVDVKEAPSFDEAEYTFTVPEDSAIGHSVGTAVATDQDDGDTLTYSISGEAFGIDANGAITVAAALDHETTPSYSLTVTVEDPDGLLGTASVSITVTDVNEAPAFDEEEYTFTVAEDALVGASRGQRCGRRSGRGHADLQHHRRR